MLVSRRSYFSSTKPGPAGNISLVYLFMTRALLLMMSNKSDYIYSADRPVVLNNVILDLNMSRTLVIDDLYTLSTS